MLKAVAEAARYWPGCSDGTLVTMPAKGACTIVCASWRAASSRAASCVLVARMIFHRRIGIAVQVGGEAGELLLQRGELLLRDSAGILARVVERGLRREAVGEQLLLALEVDRIVVDVGFCACSIWACMLR